MREAAAADSGTRRTRVAAGSAVAVVLLSPVATWWLVGDLSEPEPRDGGLVNRGLDYTLRPPRLPALVETTIGVFALVLAACALVVVVSGFRRRDLDSRWAWVVGCATVAGIAVGLFGRVLTAGVIGANIGAGILLPLVVALVVTAIVIAVVVARDVSRAPRRDTR